MEFLEKLLSQYGFGVAMTAVMCFFFYQILQWFRDLQEKITVQAVSREEKITLQALEREKQSIETQKQFFLVLDGYREAQNLHTSQSQIFHQEMKTAFEYNRKEHEQLSKEHVQMIEQNAEITKSLGRINGYKSDNK